MTRDVSVAGRKEFVREILNKQQPGGAVVCDVYVTFLVSSSSRLCLFLVAFLSALLVAIVALKRKRDAAESQSLRALLASSRAAVARAQLSATEGARSASSPPASTARGTTIGRTAEAVASAR